MTYIPYLKRAFLVLLVVTAALMSAVSVSGQTMDDRPLYRAVVLSVEDAPAGELHSDFPTQYAHLEILNGPYEGSVVTSETVITGNPYYDMILESGQRILVHAQVEGETVQFHPAEFVRDRTVFWLVAVFFILLVAIGGIQGLKTLLSLGIMGILVLYVMLPLLLAGWNPLVVTIGITSLGALVFLLLIGGASRKTAAAIGGTISGLLFGGILATLAGSAANLTGLSSAEAQILQYLGPGIDFRGLLFSGIILGALGAALDVGMSIASSMDQIQQANPDISTQALLQRGFNVGRDVLGTMANTLILAYVGSSLPLLLLFHWQDARWGDLLHMDLIASEMVRALAGSIGLAFAVPATAVLAAWMFRPGRQTRRQSKVDASFSSSRD